MSNETTPVGPYTIEARESEPHNQNFFRVVGPHFIGGWLTNAEADYLCRHLNSAYAAGQASREQWISVDERLPENELKPVLVKTKDEAGWEQLFSAYCSEDEDPAYWILDMPMLCENQKDVRIPGVTHWTELPSPPNKQP